MKNIRCLAGALLLLTTLYTAVSCDDAPLGVCYEETVFPVGTAKWRSDVSADDQAVISNLINNMVQVEPCVFHMGVQGKTYKRYNYYSGTGFGRDTIWHDKVDDSRAYHVRYNVVYTDSAQTRTRVRRDTAWLEAGAFHFLDTLKQKTDTTAFAVVYKYGGYWVGPVTEISMPEYYIGKFEITQREWTAVMHKAPRGHFYIYAQEPVKVDSAWYSPFGLGDNVAAYNIWYQDAVEFCDSLSALTGLQFRLPTEAEWECAARGGKYSRGYKYAGSDDYEEAGWVRSNSAVNGMYGENYGVHCGGEKVANELGLYDMTGNVSEWVSNCYYHYSALDTICPTGTQPTSSIQDAASTDTLIMRGGSWMQQLTVYYNPSVRKHCIMNSYQVETDGVLDEGRTEESLQSAFVNCGFRICISGN
ncbi:MAG: formylglycine-generating enzyme family protein [Bacteroidales bacterium]|nr:formylglycine-generating enzyme family protein [Bacteroidales bacterium]